MIIKRARTNTDKSLRIDAIIQSAKKNITNNSFDNCNLNSIAKDVGITKTALYRYFRIKELIFLELYLRELSSVVKQLEKSIYSMNAKKITSVLLKHPVFCKLSSILTTILEPPLQLEEAIFFKQEIVRRLSPLVTSLEKELSIEADASVNWLMHLLATIIGCWHITNTSEMMQTAYKTPELGVFQLDFSIELEKHIHVLLLDLI